MPGVPNATDKVNKKSAPSTFSVEKLCELIPPFINGSMPIKFPHKFHVVRIKGSYRLLEEKPGQIVELISRRYAGACLSQFTSKLESFEFGKLYHPGTAETVIDAWANQVKEPLAELPCAFRFKSDPGLTFKRFDFDTSPVDNMDGCPTWAEIATRCDNWKALCTWVWGLFEPNSERAQYLYLHGHGGDSKSRIANALIMFFGSSGTAATSELMKNRFFPAGLLGKRLCYITECPASFPSSSLFKTLTGDEFICAEEKHRDSFTARIETKFLITSNKEPLVDSSPADRRRIIFVKLSRFLGDLISEGEYNALLISEMQAYLSYCKQCWIDNGGGIIKYETEFDFESTDEERALKILTDHFDIDEKGRTPRNVVTNILAHAGVKDGYKVSEIKSVWERIHGIRVRSLRTGDGEAVKVYFGIRIKPTTTYGRPQIGKDGQYVPSKIAREDSEKH